MPTSFSKNTWDPPCMWCGCPVHWVPNLARGFYAAGDGSKECDSSPDQRHYPRARS